MTLRELRRNAINFGGEQWNGMDGLATPYVPYRKDAPETDGLTKSDVELAGSTGVRPVVFDRGVLFTEGQHKGVMLKAWLAKTGKTFAAIVFVDDRPHHLDGVQTVFASRPEKVLTVHFTHEQGRIAGFLGGDKRRAREQWCALSSGLSGGIASALADGTMSGRFRTCPLLPRNG